MVQGLGVDRLESSEDDNIADGVFHARGQRRLGPDSSGKLQIARLWNRLKRVAELWRGGVVGCIVNEEDLVVGVVGV